MSLATGSRLGVYEVLETLGAGGMGQVFRARDTTLGRDVAIKILPEDFTHDPERVARFRREAQILASLNHPNIGAIYGLDETSSTQFLVLELVDGESLAARLERGPLGLNEAMAVATDVALALEAAHEQGIVHRDLKPANIVLTRDGRAKVLDFGLAKATDGGSNPSQSPAITFMATMAQTQGVILGTAAYMSPEQAKGQAADKRTDVWAFGCVLYEMLSGRKPFAGEDISDTIASVLRDTPDWNALPAALPAGVRGVIVRCLEKNRRDRIPDVSAARLLLAESMAGPGASAGMRSRGSSRSWLPWSIAALLAVSLGGVIARSVLSPPRAPAGHTVRLIARTGADGELFTQTGSSEVLSPDGRLIAFAVLKQVGALARLYVRRADELNARLLPGTDGAYSPFFSPDSQWVGFFAEGKLKKISVAGGVAMTIAEAQAGRGAAWAADGTIIFQPRSAGTMLLQVPSSGGTPVPVFKMPTDNSTQRWPQLLPGDKSVLYTAALLDGTAGNRQGFNNGSLMVQSLSGGAPKTVVSGGYYGRYVPTGQLLYVHDAALLAAPFDLDKLQVTGPAVSLAEGLAIDEATGGAQYSVSGDGTLVYLAGNGVARSVPLAWLSAGGSTTPLRSTPAELANPRFSPDGRLLAMDIADRSRDVWVYDWARDTLSRVTSDGADNTAPVWSPDGRDLIFSSKRDTRLYYNLYVRHADGTGPFVRLTTANHHQISASWHPSGKYFAYAEQSPDTNFDLMVLPLDGDSTTGWKAGTPTPFLRTPSIEQEPAFSSDGRWLAYQSDESGRVEVYVRPFPGGDRKWQISSAGGSYAVWSKTEHALYYTSPDWKIVKVPFTVTGDTFAPGKPQLWSPIQITPGIYRRFDLHPDGQRMAVARAVEDTARTDSMTLVFNLFDDLRRRTAPAK
jgi:Tol biopolymer transport system component/predicted Ser/Thr protein kinase